MRTVEISLTKTSIQKAINALERTKKSMQSKLTEVAKRLADEGRNQAEMAYGRAIDVRVEEVEDGFILSANGDAVVFLEFGAGSATDYAHPYAPQMASAGVLIEPGSWSREHANQYASQGWWFWGGRVYMAVQPMHGMLRAADEIKYLADRICREVFGNDRY